MISLNTSRSRGMDITKTITSPNQSTSMALGVLKFTASYANEESYTEEDEVYSRKKAILFTNLGLCYKAMEKYDEAFEIFGEA